MSLVVGLDVGTSSAKAVVYGVDGSVHSIGRAPTVWSNTADGVEADADQIAQSAIAALNQAVEGVDQPVVAVGITSMAESGVLVGPDGRPVAPVIAWHDARDLAEVAELDNDIGAEQFAGHTGKPLRHQWSLTKHLWLMRHLKSAATATRRFNVAEWVVRELGGDEVTELSLACRTGWFDLAARNWWDEALQFSGADASLFPPLIAAGDSAGTISSDQVHPQAHGAALTVVGHDHQAAAVGVGASNPGDELDSCGTAEALVRTVPAYLDSAQVIELARLGITTDWSIQPERWSLLGGTEGGLAMQRVLGMLGVDRPGLAALDERALAARRDRVEVKGVGTSAVALSGIADGTTPGEVWQATVSSVTADAVRLHEAITEVVGPVGELIVTGGWTNSTAFMAAKRAAFGDLTVATVPEAGARGTAIYAARTAGLLGPGQSFTGPTDR